MYTSLIIKRLEVGRRRNKAVKTQRQTFRYYLILFMCNTHCKVEQNWAKDTIIKYYTLCEKMMPKASQQQDKNSITVITNRYRLIYLFTTDLSLLSFFSLSSLSLQQLSPPSLSLSLSMHSMSPNKLTEGLK